MQLNRDQYRQSHLSTEELLDYLHDRCWDHERHEIERHLLSCELCQEALDGLELVEEEEVTADIQELQGALGFIKQKKTINWRPMAIAASVSILLISVVWVGKIAFIDPSNEDLAMKQEETESKLDKPMTVASDSTTFPDDTELDPAEVIVEDEAKSDIEGTIDNNLSSLGSEVQEQIVIETSPMEDFADQETAELAYEPEEKEIIEQLPEVSGEELSFGATEDEGFGAASDDFLATEEIVEQPVMNLSGEAAAEDLMLNESSARRAKAKKSMSATGAVQRSTSVSTMRIEPEPLVGYNEFESYLRANLVYPAQAKQDSIQGTVVLNFQVDARGNVVNYNVISSLNESCDQEAIRLVKEGPEWVPGTVDGVAEVMDVSITVQFRLEN